MHNKYSIGERVLTLGESFVPRNDSKHFCKPTDVVVSNDGSVVCVANWHCNSCIVKFDSNRNYLNEYQMPENGQPI